MKKILQLVVFTFSIWCANAQTTVNCTQPPLQFAHCYDNEDDTTWWFESSDGSPIKLTFNSGGIEADYDEILIYDGADNTATLLYQGDNDGDLSGLVFESTGDSLFFEIETDISGSCAAPGLNCCTTPWNMKMVNAEVLGCISNV
ncbi:CUB domain-containing protein [uncultured Psychroserpens sp.]|uniref:CUB domain-containing protein n=1 Tax=uncultured Psychroserpens sp. TaxID=255436 RepID=UPI00262B28D3|nr:CUB domain-containing protein [uncultured Psychroserpens sp.]